VKSNVVTITVKERLIGLTFRAFADTTEIKVKVKGIKPSGEWETPFTVEAPEGSTVEVQFPLEIVFNNMPHTIGLVEYGAHVGEGKIVAIASMPREVIVHYERKIPGCNEIRVSSTTPKVGEEVIIEGTICPVPENRNVQLIRYYWCRDHYRRASDLWTTCNDQGYFRFQFRATILEPVPGYCNIVASQKQRYIVRYQRRVGEPPRTLGSVTITVYR